MLQPKWTELLSRTSSSLGNGIKCSEKTHKSKDLPPHGISLQTDSFCFFSLFSSLRSSCGVQEQLALICWASATTPAFHVCLLQISRNPRERPDTKKSNYSLRSQSSPLAPSPNDFKRFTFFLCIILLLSQRSQKRDSLCIKESNNDAKYKKPPDITVFLKRLIYFLFFVYVW